MFKVLLKIYMLTWASCNGNIGMFELSFINFNVDLLFWAIKKDILKFGMIF